MLAPITFHWQFNESTSKSDRIVDIRIQLHIRLEEHYIEFLTWCFIYRLNGFMFGVGNLLVFRDSCERRKEFEWTKRIYVWCVLLFCKTAAFRTFVPFSIRSNESNQRRDDRKMIEVPLKICWRTFGIANFKFNATNIVVKKKNFFDLVSCNLHSKTGKTSILSIKTFCNTQTLLNFSIQRKFIKCDHRTIQIDWYSWVISNRQKDLVRVILKHMRTKCDFWFHIANNK